MLFSAALTTPSLTRMLPPRTRRLLRRDVLMRRNQRIFGILLLLCVAAFVCTSSYKRKREELAKRHAAYAVVRGQVMHVEHAFDQVTGSAYVDDLVVSYEQEQGQLTTRTFDYKHDVTSDDVLPQVGDSVYVSYDRANPADAFVMPIRQQEPSSPVLASQRRQEVVLE